MLYAQVGKQAQMLSYLDVFHVLMLVVYGAIPLLFLMQGAKPGQSPAGAA
jgi:DHA2 family multidrug resistance protein